MCIPTMRTAFPPTPGADEVRAAIPGDRNAAVEEYAAVPTQEWDPDGTPRSADMTEADYACPRCGEAQDCACLETWEIVRLTDLGAMAGRRVVTTVLAWKADPDLGETRVTFTGPDSGPGPVVMLLGPAEHEQHYVVDPARFGDFGTEWVRRFYGVTA